MSMLLPPAVSELLKAALDRSVLAPARRLSVRLPRTLFQPPPRSVYVLPSATFVRRAESVPDAELTASSSMPTCGSLPGCWLTGSTISHDVTTLDGNARCASSSSASEKLKLPAAVWTTTSASRARGPSGLSPVNCDRSSDSIVATRPKSYPNPREPGGMPGVVLSGTWNIDALVVPPLAPSLRKPVAETLPNVVVPATRTSELTLGSAIFAASADAAGRASDTDPSPTRASRLRSM